MNSKWLWDSLAKSWDKPGVGLGQNDIRILEKTHKYLNAGYNILDYGCATGSIAFEIAVNVKEVQGIDISSKMIDIAKRKAGERQAKNVNFTQSTIYDERFEKGSFNIILAFNILHLLENPAQVFNRLNLLLKPGGFFISATPCLGEKKKLSMLLNTPIFLLSKTGILPRVNFFSISGLKQSFTNNDFQIVETESLSLQPISEIFIAARKV